MFFVRMVAAEHTVNGSSLFAEASTRALNRHDDMHGDSASLRG